MKEIFLQREMTHLLKDLLKEETDQEVEDSEKDLVVGAIVEGYDQEVKVSLCQKVGHIVEIEAGYEEGINREDDQEVYLCQRVDLVAGIMKGEETGTTIEVDQEVSLCQKEGLAAETELRKEAKKGKDIGLEVEQGAEVVLPLEDHIADHQAVVDIVECITVMQNIL